MWRASGHFPPCGALFRRAPGRLALLLLLLALLGQLGGCGLLAKNTDPGAQGADTAQGAQAGENGEGSGDGPAWDSDPVPYKVDIEVVDGPGSLKGQMRDVSQLVKLVKEPPDSMLALERRARADEETAVKLLHSQCYYDGNAAFTIDEAASPVKVTLTLTPGPRFTVGRADVHYEPPPVIPDAFLHRTRVTGFWGLERETLPAPAFPDSVPGVTVGEPIVADAMLAAVSAMPEALRRTGYPLAKVTESRYTVDPATRTLNADITINSGPPALMGKVEIHGNKEVNTCFLERLVPWTPGEEPWDDEMLTDYANSLRALGLFRSVEAAPVTDDMRLEHRVLGPDGKEGDVGVVPAGITVAEGPPRSVSASARYDTDTGFGVEGTWEHRNLFHNGERLTLDAPISQQEIGLKAAFEKPAFLQRGQRLLANGAALWENTDAYQQESLKGEVGIDRRLARQWWGGIHLGAEGGWLKDNEHEKRPYGVIEPKAGIRHDSRNNKLNPSSGMEAELKLLPFSGFYEEFFGAFATTLSVAGYYAPYGKKPDGKIDDRLVLAGRVEGGAMPGASSLKSIPASLRYFTGGAGSVRGYAYQAIGPRDKEGDPLGGRSYQVVNLEARFMVAENVGIVPFLDGGMVYKDEFPQIIGDMDWGTGLGFRYYTPIGPVRLDVATPLHRIDGDPPVQVYISIGQSF
ncbi:MAG: outer membrane protein assembly factor [Desulfovibrio sp.]|nr:outer membrane protein assembly factor [Desulfovibrio sp.]